MASPEVMRIAVKNAISHLEARVKGEGERTALSPLDYSAIALLLEDHAGLTHDLDHREVDLDVKTIEVVQLREQVKRLTRERNKAIRGWYYAIRHRKGYSAAYDGLPPLLGISQEQLYEILNEDTREDDLSPPAPELSR